MANKLEGVSGRAERRVSLITGAGKTLGLLPVLVIACTAIEALARLSKPISIPLVDLQMVPQTLMDLLLIGSGVGITCLMALYSVKRLDDDAALLRRVVELKEAQAELSSETEQAAE